MLSLDHILTRIYHPQNQIFGFLPSLLLTICQCKVVHADKRIWMSIAQQSLSCLHYPLFHDFSLLPFSLMSVNFGQVS